VANDATNQSVLAQRTLPSESPGEKCRTKNGLAEISLASAKVH